jgi:hypothetical protein
VTVNYGRINFVGSAIIGSVLALAPTLLIYLAVNRKVESLASFFPLAILLTWVVLWGWQRSIKENADSVRRRYQSGRAPLGK